MAAPLQNLLNTYVALALEKSLLVIHKMLRLLVHTFTADDKHYLLNRENLAQRIQMQISQKQKSFSQFSFAFLK